MEQHVKAVAILNIVLGGLGVLIAVFVLLFFGGLAALEEGDAEGAAILGIIGVVGSAMVALLSVPQVIAGIGLLRYREWARVLGMVVSALNLLSLPLGTALGVYGLWVLTKDETSLLFKQKSVGMPVAMAR
jgi:hypothetical protein